MSDRPTSGCGTCDETNLPNVTHGLQQLVACETNDIDSLDAAIALVREDIAAIRAEADPDE